MDTLNHCDFDYIRELVHRHTAIILDKDKKYLVESRLMPVAYEEGLASIQELIRRLQAQTNAKLLRRVTEALTTNETYFFRDNHPFEALKSQILPEILANLRGGGRLSIWSAACSSGQEPYSIAMLIQEYFPQLVNAGLRIYSTDLSSEMLSRASEGLFSDLEVSRGLPSTFLAKYFERRAQGGWQIKQDIRDMVDFRQLNLAERWPPLPGMDLIFMRNVLIYFEVETKKQILAKARQLLKPRGYLFLGTSETLLNLDNAFQRVIINNSTCYQLLANQGR